MQETWRSGFSTKLLALIFSIGSAEFDRLPCAKRAAARPPECGLGYLDSSGREISPALTSANDPQGARGEHRLLPLSGDETPDPRDIYERALTFLQADYFQDPEAFGDRLVSVLSAGAALAASLLAEGECILAFEQGRQRYQLPCKVREMKPGSAAREAAIWHNRLFNPALPDTVHVLEFKPDWTSATRGD